jgi:hypothetical protein
LSVTLSANTMIFLQRSRELSVTLDSGITECMCCSTSSHPPATVYVNSISN